MSNEIFPELPGLKWDTAKKPTWSTKIHEATNGKETTAAYWSYPKWFFSLSYEVLDNSALVRDLQKIGGFFLARKGAFDDFLYRDPSDCQVEGQEIGTGDGARTTFQLVRSFGEFDEPMKKVEGAIEAPINATAGGPAPPEGSPTIYIDGARQTTYTISTSGLVTFPAPPANGAIVTADFSFYFRCRFMRDELEFTEFMKDLWELKKLELAGKK